MQLPGVDQAAMTPAPFRTGRSRRVWMAPEIPPGYVQRREEFAELRGHLLRAPGGTVAISTALHGAGGYGKTTLAVALCHDEEVQRAFPDGVLWVTLGQEPDLKETLLDLIQEVSGARPATASFDAVLSRWAGLLNGRRFLVVVDDVWKASHLKPFLTGGRECARLVTTRDFKVAADFQRVNVDQMTARQAVDLLLSQVGTALPATPDDLTPFYDLARRLGEWPLLLELAGAVMRHLLARGYRFRRALQYLNQRLDAKGPQAFDPDGGSEAQRNEAVSRCVEASLNMLDPRHRSWFLKLGIFPEDTAVPVSTLAALWGVGRHEAEAVVLALSDLALLRFDPESLSVTLHDVMRGYLGSQVQNAAALHAQLVDAWRDPHNLPDGYAWKHIGHHLLRAHRREKLRELLFDYSWMRAKLVHAGIYLLAAEYEPFRGDPDAREIQGALRLGANVLRTDADQLATQLHGRLLGTARPGVRAFLERLSGQVGHSWIAPVAASLNAPGGPMVYSLEMHANVVTDVAAAAGRWGVSCSHDRTLRVWNLETGDGLHVLEGHEGDVDAVAVLPDNRRIVSGGKDSKLCVWDLERGTLLASIARPGFDVYALVPLKDNRRLLCAGWSSEIEVWDLDAGELSATLKGHRHSVTSVAVLPGSRRCVSASRDRTLKLWDLGSGELLRSSPLHPSPLEAVAVVPDRRLIVAGDRDGRLHLWSPDLTRHRTLRGRHAGAITALAALPKLGTVVSSSRDAKIGIWNVRTRAPATMLVGHEGWVNGVAAVPGRGRVISGSDDRTVKCWELNEGEAPLAGARDQAPDLIVAMRDGKHVVCCFPSHTIQVWDILSGTLVRTFAVRLPEHLSARAHPSRRIPERGGRRRSPWPSIIESRPLHVPRPRPEARGVSAAIERRFQLDGARQRRERWRSLTLADHDREGPEQDAFRTEVFQAIRNDWEHAATLADGSYVEIDLANPRSIMVWGPVTREGDRRGPVLARFTADDPIERFTTIPWGLGEAGRTIVACDRYGRVHILRLRPGHPPDRRSGRHQSTGA